MAQTFTNSDLCHVFAQQSQEYGRNAGKTLFFESNIIYSYGHHYPMAKILNGFALVNSTGYSNTTAKQTSYLLRALHQKIIHVPNPKAETKEEHRENLNAFMDNVLNFQHKASRARKEESRDFYEIQARKEVEQLTQYLELFNIKPLKKYRLLIESDDLSETTEAERTRRANAEKRAKAKLRKAEREKLTRWKKGENIHIFTGHQGHELLRIKGDQIETSKGIKIDFKEGKRLFNIVSKVRESGEKFTPKQTLKVNHYYTVNWIDKNGDFKAGCHLIKWPEIEETAKSLNWL